MRIRDAVSDDAPALAAVHEASAKTAYREIFAGFPFRAPAREDWLAEIAASTVVVAEEEDGAVMGFTIGGRSRDPIGEGGEIYSLYVAPSCWRRGVGSRLLAEAVRRLEPLGPLTLWVLEENHAARRFYERHGWRPDGGEKKTFYGALELRYRLRVSSDPGSA
jgi:ribosomal protein S18 acetylase RimI-like enzyme